MRIILTLTIRDTLMKTLMSFKESLFHTNTNLYHLKQLIQKAELFSL